MSKQPQKPKSAYSTSTSAKPKAAPKKKSGLSPLVLIGIIAGAVLVVGGLIWAVSNSMNAPLATTTRTGEGAAWGPVDAPVKIIDFSDFGCSHCRDFAQNQEKQLLADYGETGKVRFEFHHMIIGGTPTRDAANASECAADQGRFWDYHDALFARQGTSANPFTKPLLKRYAAELGLDAAKFDPCVDQNLHYNTVAANESDARSRGVNATPTFFINDKRIEGAVPYEQFKAEIEAALAAAQ